MCNLVFHVKRFGTLNWVVGSSLKATDQLCRLEFLESRTAPSESPEPLAKPVEEGVGSTRPDHRNNPSPVTGDWRCTVWRAARLRS